MDDVVESESGVVLRSLSWAARSCNVPKEVPRKEDGVKGVNEELGGERTDMSREPRRGRALSEDGGDSIIGQRDLSMGNGRPCSGWRCARIAAACISVIRGVDSPLASGPVDVYSYSKRLALSSADYAPNGA